MSTTKHLGLCLAAALAASASACSGDDGHGTGGGHTGGAADCAPDPGRRLLRRLSRGEYDATIRDLLGVDSAYGGSFTADTVVKGFDNNASALVVSPLLAEQFRTAAEGIAASALASPAAIVPCPVATGDAACAAKLVDSLGPRAFRRPLTASEKARYVSLYDVVAKDDGFAVGAQTVIAAMLQSPSFLYRTELGGGAAGTSADRVALTPWEIASELSYMLWGTMPDEALFAAAASGALETEEGIESQARRLIADPRADAAISRFVEGWLSIDRLSTVPKDMVAYPAFDTGMRASMREETRRFVRRVVREGSGALPELLTGETTFVNAELATLYGISMPASPDAAGFAEVALGDGARGGLLGQGSVLATHARPSSSSPIHRGKLVRERLLCQEMTPPPPGLIVQPPPLDPSLTTRESFAAHASVEPCKSCHRLMDPIGFGFESFDGIGALRTTEGGKPIDAHGEILATKSTDGTFNGLHDLRTKLAASPDVRSCFARQWARFAYGATEDEGLSCLSTQLGADYAGGDLRIDGLLVMLVKAAHFRERTRDGSEGPAQSSGSGGSGAGGNSGTGGSGGTGGGGTMPVDGLEVTTVVDSQWAGGYQETVTVKNVSAGDVTWTVTIPVQGSIVNIWNAKATPVGAQTAFIGETYNAVLAPQMSTSFGFVAGN